MVWSVRNISLHSKGASMQLAKVTVKRCLCTPPCSSFVIVYFRDLNLFHPGFLLHQLESLFFFSPTMTGMKIAKTYRCCWLRKYLPLSPHLCGHWKQHWPWPTVTLPVPSTCLFKDKYAGLGVKPAWTLNFPSFFFFLSLFNFIIIMAIASQI